MPRQSRRHSTLARRASAAHDESRRPKLSPEKTARPRTDEDRAANPVSTRLVDEKHLIEKVPLADPVALGTATLLPPAKVNESIPVDPDPETVHGEPIPEPEHMTGVDQNRIEVLTGKRLQRDSQPVAE